MITYLREDALDKLKKTINDKLDKYRSDTPWIGKTMGSAKWSATMELDGIELPNLSVSANPGSDVDNIIKLHKAMKNLPLRIAADERFWCYQTHFTYWKYMRARWPVDKKPIKKAVKTVQSKYFFTTEKRRVPLFENGIARLWWYGQTAYNPSLDNPYELVPYMMTTQRIAAIFVERINSRCPKVARSLLCALKKEKEEGRPFRDTNNFIALMRWLNLKADFIILDSLPEEKLLSMIQNQIQEIRNDNQEGMSSKAGESKLSASR